MDEADRIKAALGAIKPNRTYIELARNAFQNPSYGEVHRIVTELHPIYTAKNKGFADPQAAAFEDVGSHLELLAKTGDQDVLKALKQDKQGIQEYES